MGIRTGKLFLMVVFFVSSILCKEAKIGHRLLSQKGVLIKNAIEGEPFLLEISVQDANLITAFKIGNLEQFKVRDFRRITNQSIVNGIKTETKSFTYSLVAEKTGNFEIGPVTIKADDNIIVTDPFEVLVKERSTNEPFKNSAEPRALLKMFIDSK